MHFDRVSQANVDGECHWERENRPDHRGDWFLILFGRVVRKPFRHFLKQISVRPTRWALLAGFDFGRDAFSDWPRPRP